MVGKNYYAVGDKFIVKEKEKLDVKLFGMRVTKSLNRKITQALRSAHQQHKKISKEELIRQALEYALDRMFVYKKKKEVE